MSDKNKLSESIERILEMGEEITISLNDGIYRCFVTPGTFAESDNLESAVVMALDVFQEWWDKLE